MILRTYVSTNAPGKARPLFEAMGLNSTEYFIKHPQNEEEATQAGLKDWIKAKEPTWEMLLEAMEYAKLGIRVREELKEKILSQTGDLIVAIIPLICLKCV